MRIALGLHYDGSGFEGWQSQPSGNTVQDHVERALSAVAGGAVRTVVAGRTDAGVHACGQVLHFDTDVARPITAWVRGVNAHLPESVAAQWAQEVDDSFHARFSAVGRRYIYVLYNAPVRPALYARQVGWFHEGLDVEAMQRGAQCLVGEHDFSSFRSSECQAVHPRRLMARAEVRAQGAYVVFEFVANGFLHHMVRNLVGALVYIGKGAHPPEWLGDLLELRDRTHAPPTFSPSGLYLAQVDYPDAWQLPVFAPIILPLATPSEEQ